MAAVQPKEIWLYLKSKSLIVEECLGLLKSHCSEDEKCSGDSNEWG